MSISPSNIAITDEAELERRARALATDEPERDVAPTGRAHVTFHLGGARCALEVTALERAVLRLEVVFELPLSGGEARAAAFVDERPVPVVDLVRPARDTDALRGVPALLIPVEAGPVAVAVEGPIDLTEAPVVAVAKGPPIADDGPPLVGRLADGAALLDTRWIRELAARAFMP